MPKMMTTKEFIIKAITKHGGLYDYSNVIYINNNTNVKVYCTQHDNYFEQSPKKHLRGSTACKACYVEKRKKACLKKYGFVNPSQVPSIKEQKKQTCYNNHGVEHPGQSKEIQEKAKQTNLTIFGFEHAIQSPEIQKKIININLNKYGVEYAYQSTEFKEKSKQTMLERYGVDHASQSKEIKEKANQTMLERYGVENPFESKEIQEKIKQTNLDRYGVEHPSQSKEIQKKIKQTNLERYGVENPSQSHISKESLSLLNNPIWLTEQHHGNELTLTRIGIDLGVDDTTVGNYFKKHNIEVRYFEFSMGEKEVLEYITSILPPKTNIQNNIRTVISPYELDIYLPEYKLAIEYNGEYWHRNSQKKDALKEHLCKEQGITLLTIWENQWLNNRLLIEQILIHFFHYNNS